MRITPFMIFDQLTRGILGANQDLNSLNEQLVSGKKINKPSDDVLGMKSILDYKLTLQSYDQFGKNGVQASNTIKFTDTILTQVGDVLAQLSSLSQTGLQGLNDPSARTLYAAQATTLRDQLLELGNASFGNRYIFSGYKTDTQSFDPATYAYQGDSGVMNVMIDTAASVSVNIPGDQVFSVSYASPKVVQTGGNYVHYTAGAGTVTNVEIRASDDTTVLDSFSFSNAIQMADLLANAVNNQDSNRIGALQDPFSQAVTAAQNASVVNQLRSARIEDQKDLNTTAGSQVQSFLSKTEDADMNAVITAMQKAQVAITAMQISSSKMLQQSLMDFLA